MTNKEPSHGGAIALGVAIGVAIGAATGHIGPWLAIGAGIGLLMPYHLGKRSAESAKPEQMQK
jgi:hypothetical protein